MKSQPLSELFPVLLVLWVVCFFLLLHVVEKAVDRRRAEREAKEAKEAAKIERARAKFAARPEGFDFTGQTYTAIGYYATQSNTAGNVVVIGAPPKDESAR